MVSTLSCQAPEQAPRAKSPPPVVERQPPAEPKAVDSPAPPAAASEGQPQALEPVPSDLPQEHTGPCSPGMALVDGGVISKKQHTRWTKLYPEAAPPPAEVGPFCLDLLEATEEDLVASGEAFVTKLRVKPRCYPRGDCGRLPLEYLHPQEAAQYCALKGGRLPTLVEWLWAAGGGAEDRKFAWGSEPPTSKHLNACDFACARAHMGDCSQKEHDTGYCTERNMSDIQGEDGYEERAPVGSYPAGAGRWGHLDLAGNVTEYTVGGGGSSFYRCGGTYKRTRRMFSFSLHKEMCDPEDVGADPVSVRCVSAPTRTVTPPPR